MSDQPKQTRLGYRLREALKSYKGTGDVVKDDAFKGKVNRAANALDVAVFSLGRKGDGIKSLRAYREASRLFELTTGKPYVA